MDKQINDAYNKYGRLMVYETGSGSPCLDLRNINCDLADACETVDLVIIEGMGRAMHTNFHARFICDSLKLAGNFFFFFFYFYCKFIFFFFFFFFNKLKFLNI